MRAARAILLITMAVAIAIGLLAVGYAWSTTTHEEHTVQMAELSLGFTGVSCGDPAGTIDLGSDPPKDVGWTVCDPVDTDNDGDFDVLQVNVFNAYPGYQVVVTGTIANLEGVPIVITGATLQHNDDPVAVVLEGFWTDFNLTCKQLDPGETLVGEFWLYLNVTQPALQGHPYTFQVDITGGLWTEVCQEEDLGGTPGFWGNWDNHNTYTQTEIEAWLADIDDASQWLGPLTTEGMADTFDAGSGKDPYLRFLRHYLATRLDAASGRLALAKPHDVSALDPGNYLGLTTPTAATLSEIIAAIESKFGTAPTSDEFNVMKDVCDALNNLLA